MKPFKIYLRLYITNKLPELKSSSEIYKLDEEDVYDIADEASEYIEPNYGIEIYTKTHSDGWTISGVIYENWFKWVPEFTACHPVYGSIFSVFHEFKVMSESREAYNHFITHHPIFVLDLYDV
jgi:hypothetical protein